MQEVFEKIIEKLEEYEYLYLVERDSEQLQHCKDVGDCGMRDCTLCVFDKAIEIVKQEAELYNVMIDGEYCFQSCGCTEMCGKCSRIANGDTDYYESICAFSEQTNADRIRSFSDEELAEFLSDPEIFSPCKNCDFHFVYAMNDDCKAPDGWICTKGYVAALIQKWLQSEV